LRFLPAGDLAVCVELGEAISVEVNTRVRALEFLIQQKGLTGVVETVPAYSSLLVYYDPRAVGYEPLCAAIAELVPQATTAVLPPPRTVELPCCYDDPELGFDLAAAAKRLDLSPDDLAQLHAGAEYLVYFIGFTPGLPYMTGMPARINIGLGDWSQVFRIGSSLVLLNVARISVFLPAAIFAPSPSILMTRMKIGSTPSSSPVARSVAVRKPIRSS